MRRNEIELIGYFLREVHVGGSIVLYDFKDFEHGQFLLGADKFESNFKWSGQDSIYKVKAEVSSTVRKYLENDNFIKTKITITEAKEVTEVKEINNILVAKVNS